MNNYMIDCSNLARSSTALLIVVCMLLAACGSNADKDLPDASLAITFQGCSIVSVSPAVAMPAISDGSGLAARKRAKMLHAADCLPDIDTPSDWYVPYRMQFEQIFTENLKGASGFAGGGAPGKWSSETNFLVDWDAPSREVDVSTEGMGKNCAILLDKLDTTALACITSIDESEGNRFQNALQGFKAQSKFTLKVKGESDLNARLLARDVMCLQYWRQVQHQLEGRFNRCAVQ
ncbi:hypothetical protein [Arenicella xantha]|uniref:Uncharacterized protein n=1 Tax=Arenicella xantha TaxID=644221 RepID=A0A395JN38_9GAMM|nr:hypothetical protein [Arenicella xantha]RBP51028.1 hypothetical protein DFR28_102447 [Arenicella xantha]